LLHTDRVRVFSFIIASLFRMSALHVHVYLYNVDGRARSRGGQVGKLFAVLHYMGWIVPTVRLNFGRNWVPRVLQLSYLPAFTDCVFVKLV